MPKKSSKKSSKKATSAPETTLVPHRAPNLTDLLERAKGGKLRDIQQYLKAGGSANVLQPLKGFGLVPLLFYVAAVSHSDAAASIKLLLEAGAAVDAASSSIVMERTPLMMVCSKPHALPAVHALLQGGADPCHQASSDGISALHVAVTAGLTETCAVLCTASSGRVLELTCNLDGDGHGMTPLMAACALKHYAVVELLCALGADVNHSSTTGSTPLITAASEKHDTGILQFLLKCDGIQLNHRNGKGDTALMKAAKAGNAAAVEMLLQSGADATIINKDGLSAVSLAIVTGHLHVLKRFIQQGLI
jgi:ankyrin repeat protein